MTVRSAVNDCCHIELVGAVTTGSEPAVPMAIAHVHGRFPADAEIDHAERRDSTQPLTSRSRPLFGDNILTFGPISLSDRGAKVPR